MKKKRRTIVHKLCKNKKLHTRKSQTVQSSLLRKTTDQTAIPQERAGLNTKELFKNKTIKME